MTLDEFETRIVDMRDDIVNLTPILTEIGNDITRELQQAAPTGKTGNLQSSIRLEVQPQQFAVSMLAYGVFQNNVSIYLQKNLLLQRNGPRSMGR